MSERFDLVFSGDFARGVDETVAKKNLAALFKISPQKVDALFSGKPITLKKNLDFDTGNKYRVAIKKAGCIAQLVEQKDSAVEPKKEKAVFAAQEPAAQTTVSPPQEHASAVQSDVPPAPKLSESKTPDQDSGSGLSLAPTGAEVLRESERTAVAPVQVETAHLSIAETGSDLLDSDEKEEVVAPSIEFAVDLAPVGSDLLEASDKDEVVPVEVNLSGLSLAEPGADLEQIDDAKPKVAPDISHLSIKE